MLSFLFFLSSPPFFFSKGHIRSTRNTFNHKVKSGPLFFTYKNTVEENSEKNGVFEREMEQLSR